MQRPALPRRMMRSGDLPRRERAGLLAGTALIAAFVGAHATYLLVGHRIVGLMFAHEIVIGPRSPLDAWLEGADRRFTAHVGIPLLFAALAGVALVAWSLRSAPPLAGIREFWRSIAGAPRVAMVCLCLALVTGHVLNHNRLTFPFVRWDMYTGRYEPARFSTFDLYVITTDGRRSLVNIGRTIPSIHRGAPAAFMRYEQARLAGGTPEDPGQDLAIAIARLYGELHDLSVARIEVVEKVVERDATEYRRSMRVVRHAALPESAAQP
jgi:hypothetical protein